MVNPVTFVERMRRRAFLAWCVIPLLCLSGGLVMDSASAQDEGGAVLPMTQAYQMHARITKPGTLALHWTIAPNYYLNRGQMKFTPGDGVHLGAPVLPAGEKHHDPYLGDMEIYHHQIDATVPYTVDPGTTRLKLEVRYQGCHEVKPKICYPPHAEQIDLPLPTTAATVAGAGNGGGSSLPTGSAEQSSGKDSAGSVSSMPVESTEPATTAHAEAWEKMPAPKSAADLDYQSFLEAVKREPSKTLSRHDEELAWANQGLEVRQKAQAFLAEYPNDPRRWTVVWYLGGGLTPDGLYSIVARPYVLGWGADDADGEPQPIMDDAATAAWNARVERLQAELKTAADLPEFVRKEVALATEQARKDKAVRSRWRSGKVQAPDFTAFDLAGKPVKLSDFRGKVVVLDFWATWCHNCIEGLPHLQALAEKYAKQGVVVVASNTDDPRADFETFVKRNKDKYPNLIWTHDKAETSLSSVCWTLYDCSEGIPDTFVINRAGVVADRIIGNPGPPGPDRTAVYDAVLAKAGIQVSPEVLARGKADEAKLEAELDGQGGPLLPLAQAYQLRAQIEKPGTLALHWTIAPDYYLNRGLMKFTPGAGVHLGTPALPLGLKHHDPSLGDMEIYREKIDATVPYRVDPGVTRLKIAVQYQGCHEVTPQICYPPHIQQIDLPVPPAAVSMAGAGNSGGSSRPTGSAEQFSGEGSVGTGSVSLLAALVLAFAGGLVLNLMPCVLPVLSIKAVSVLESGESQQRARGHALWYAAGVLASFAALGVGILALRTAGHALGWGSQLQQPLLVGVLACVMLAVGLSMSGVVQFGAALGNTGAGLAARSGPTGDFFTGVLAVVVASPCTAPFMGSALAYAFAAPMLAALLVFLALGIGLALPFLLIGFVPALARLLPRPGRWMETLKQVLAFPMYLTAVWLVWVLANQRGSDAVGLVLVAMVLLAMTLWWFERSRSRGAVSRALVATLGLTTLAPMYLLAQVSPPSTVVAAEDGVVAYSPEKLAALRAADTPVFVDMTADWCVTCKANEHAVLDTQAFHALLQHTGTIYMKGDWTDVNPVISAFLQQYHSPGVPLYVVFPRNGRAGRVLPTVLTPSLVAQAVEEATRGSGSSGS